MKAFAAILALACLLPLALAVDDCTANQSQVGATAYLDTGATKFVAGNFDLYVAIPSTYIYTNFTFSGSDASCNGNSAVVTWTKQTSYPADSSAVNDACTPDLYKTTVSWENLHGHCGASRDNTDSQYLIITFNLLIDGAQSLTANIAADDQSFDFYRTINSARRIVVKFPKYISAETSTQVTNLLSDGRIPAQAALTKVQVDNSAALASSTKLNFQVVTAVTYPDIVDASTVALAAIANRTDLQLSSAGVTLVSSNCPQTAGAVCKQTWAVQILQKSDLCSAASEANFSATYKLKFPVTCQGTYAYGPACPTGDYFDMDAKIVTANFCPSVTTAQLSASLATVGATAYKLRQTANFLLTTSSSTASIQSTTLVSVQLKQTSGDGFTAIDNIDLYSAKAVTNAGTAASFAVQNSGESSNAATAVTFSAKLLPSQIVLPSGATRTITFVAQVEVVFVNTESLDGSNSVSRRLLTLEIPANAHNIKSLSSKGNDKVQAAASFDVSSNDAEAFSVEAAASSASTSTFTPIVMLLSFAAALFHMLA